MHNARSPYLLGFWSSLTLLLIQAVAAQSSYPRMASSCLPSGADAPFTQDTLLEREQIESRFHQNPKQLLTTEVPGFSALGDREPVLRGRQARVLIDGVPDFEQGSLRVCGVIGDSLTIQIISLRLP
ncbi:MAG: hypothetical protein BRC35_05350 [Cyanobacteria bacterium QH_10_48_56]|nr:MAG: hypothetical protein BRC35_05350 [Cyanobacteria bacterium QH_10_48_56]